MAGCTASADPRGGPPPGPVRRTTAIPLYFRPVEQRGGAEVTTTIPKPAEPLSPPDPLRHLTSVTTRTVLRIQHEVLRAVREHLCAQGFVELLPPVIGPVTDPGVRGSKQVDIDYYGHRYKLMTSAILYKQASLTAFDKIFCIAPNVRLEPLETASTNRHLAEFHQIDVELAGASREDAMQVVEELVGHVVQQVVAEAPGELDRLGRDTSTFADLLSE